MSAVSAPEREASAAVACPDVVVAIVNYCTAELTIDCLRSLEDEIREWPGSRVVVADNASPDGSGAVIAKAVADNGWGDWAEVLLLERNGGFAFGNNAVINAFRAMLVRPRYFWLLNSDTVVRKGAMGALIRSLDGKPEAGFAGSCLENPDGSQQCSYFRFPSHLSEFASHVKLGPFARLFSKWAVAPAPSREGGTWDWLSGASLLIRADVVDQIGPLDDDYFLYYEETDYCRIARDNGWTCWFEPESRVVHLVGRSSGVTQREGPPKRRPDYWFSSRRRYFNKHHGWAYTAATDIALAAAVGLTRIREFVLRERSELPQHFLSDILANSVLVKGTGEPAKK